MSGCPTERANMENIGAQLLNQIWNEGQPANENFEIELDDDDDRDGDGTLDGGVARNSDDTNSKPKSECDLVCFSLVAPGRSSTIECVSPFLLLTSDCRYCFWLAKKV